MEKKQLTIIGLLGLAFSLTLAVVALAPAPVQAQVHSCAFSQGSTRCPYNGTCSLDGSKSCSSDTECQPAAGVCVGVSYSNACKWDAYPNDPIICPYQTPQMEDLDGPGPWPSMLTPDQWQDNCTGNAELDCETCECSCDTVAYPCTDCSAAVGVVGQSCASGYNDPLNGVYTDVCGECACPTGYVECTDSGFPARFNRCYAATQDPPNGLGFDCPAGVSYDPCKNICEADYVLRSPTAPQIGFISMTDRIQTSGRMQAGTTITAGGDISTTGGDISASGDITGGGDVYLPDGNSIRIDGAGSTLLNIGNFTGTVADLTVEGELAVGFNSNPGYPLDVRAATPDSGTAILSVKDETGNLYTGLRLARGGGGAGSEQWYMGMEGGDDLWRLQANGGTDIITVAKDGTVSFAGDIGTGGDVTVGAGQRFRMNPGAVPSNPANGSMYFDSTANKFKCYEGGWKDCVIDQAAVGTGAAGRVTIWTSGSNLGSDSGFTYSTSGKTMSIVGSAAANPPSLNLTTSLSTQPNQFGPHIKLDHGVGGTHGYMLKLQQGGGNYFAVSDDTGSANYLVIRQDGAIGIGRDVPSQKLDVDGGIAVSGTAVVSAGRALQNVTGYGQASGNFSFSGGGNMTVSSTNPLAINSGATVGSGKSLRLTPGAKPTDVEGGMYYSSSDRKFKCYEGTPGSGGQWINCAGSGGSIGGSGAATQLAYWSASDELASEADLFWNPSSNYLGVGAPAPDYALDIRHASRPIINLADTKSSPAFNYTGLRLDRGGEKWFVGMDEAGKMVMRRNSSENEIVIDTAGDVGIGDDTPTNTLDVFGSIGIKDSTVIDGNRALLNLTGYTQDSGSFTVNGNGSFLTSTGAVSLRGNTSLGAGRTFDLGSVASAAAEAGLAGSPGMMVYRTDINKFRCYEASGWTDCGAQTGAVFGDGVAGQVAFWDGTYSLDGDAGFRWDNANKRLGLGTGTPGFPLEVVETSGSALETAIIQIHQNNPALLWTGLNLTRNGDQKWFVGMDQANHDLVFRRQETDSPLVLEETGNVGIGLRNPAVKLEVSGTVRSSGGYQVGGNTVINSARALQNVTGYTQASGGFTVNGNGTATFNTSSIVVSGGNLRNEGSTTLNGLVGVNEHMTLAANKYMRMTPSTVQPGAVEGRMYYDDVEHKFKCAEGVPTQWDNCVSEAEGTVIGTGVANQVAVWTDTTDIGYDALFTWELPENELGLGTSAPEYPLDIRQPNAGATDTAIIRINQDNATRRWTGLSLARQASEAWFLGVDDSNDNLLLRSDTHNWVQIDPSNGYIGMGGAPGASERLIVSGDARVSSKLIATTVETTNLIVNNPASPNSGDVLTYSAGVAQWQPAPGAGFPTPGSAGSTIYSNGSAWVADTSLYHDASNIAMFPSGGVTTVGIGASSFDPATRFHVVAGSVLFGSTAAVTMGSAANSGKMFWDYTKRAVRAGTDNGAWFNANLGNDSAAFGFDTRASGDRSIALGSQNTASGYIAATIGDGSTAAGDFSLALGKANQANQDGSVAIGWNTRSDAAYAVTLGKFIDTTAAASNSITIGIGGDNQGDDLENDTAGSIMLGSGSNKPTMTLLKAANYGGLGKVGIGTKVPDVLLTVSGPIKLGTDSQIGVEPTDSQYFGSMYFSATGKFRCLENATDGWYDCKEGDSGGAAVPGLDSAAGTADEANSRGAIAYWNTDTTLSGNAIYVWDFNKQLMGLGESTPGFPLDLTAKAGETPLIRIHNGGAANRYTGLRLDRGKGAEKWFVGMTDSVTSDNLVLRRNIGPGTGVNAVSIDQSNGRVGIGTEALNSAHLEVMSAGAQLRLANPTSGGLLATVDTDGLTTIEASGAAEGFILAGNRTNGLPFTLYNAYNANISNDVNLDFDFKTGGAGVQATGARILMDTTDITQTAEYADLSFLTVYNGTLAERLKLSGSGSTLTGDLTVTNKLSTPQICLDGDCQTSWPSVSLPSGSADQMLRHNGTDWEATTGFKLDGNGDIYLNGEMDIVHNYNSGEPFVGIDMMAGGNGGNRKAFDITIDNGRSNEDWSAADFLFGNRTSGTSSYDTDGLNIAWQQSGSATTQESVLKLRVKEGSETTAVTDRDVTSLLHLVNEQESISGAFINVIDAIRITPEVNGSIDNGINFNGTFGGDLIKHANFVVGSDGDLDEIKNVTYSWPSSQAAGSGYVLSNDSSGNLSWAAESDPQVGSITSGYVPRWNGSELVTGSLRDNGSGAVGIGVAADAAYSLKTDSDVYINGQLCVGGTSRCLSSLTDIVTRTPPSASPGTLAVWDSSTSLTNSGVLYSPANLNVSIGGSPDATYKFKVFGSSYASGGWISSDRRWKKNLEELEGSLSKVKRLNGISYEWRRDEFKDYNFDENRHIGLIAQEVEPILPELVKTDDQGYKSVSYQSLTAVLVEAIKELDDKLQTELADSVRLAPDGSLVVPADLLAENNAWGAESGWIFCPADGNCACPDGYFMTELYNRGELMNCHQL